MVAAAAWSVAIFSAAPSFYDLNFQWLIGTRAGDYLRLCAHPLDRDIREPILAFRILPPTVAWLMGGGSVLSLLLPYFATFLTLALVYSAVARRLGGQLGTSAALLVGLSCAVTWPNCMPGYPDSFAHACAAALLLVRPRWAVALLILGGLLSDERFALALPFIWLWHYRDPAMPSGPGWGRRMAGSATAAVAAWLLVRHALAAGWIGPGVRPPKTYADMMHKLLRVVPFQPLDQGWGAWWANVGAGFRWTWALLLGVAGWEWRAGRRLPAALLAFALAACSGATFLVFDVARSVGFVFPAIPVALAWAARHNAATTARIARVLVWLGVLTPSYWITSGEFFWWWRPLVLRLLAHYTGQDPLTWLK